MAKIGSLKETKPGQLYEGEVNTLQLSVRFEVRKLLLSSDNPNAPTHAIVAWNNDGIEVPIGSAWMKTMNKPGREGTAFMSMTFSDPSFAKPLNVAAFKTAEGNSWDVVFRHRQDKAA
ncbi:DUF736 family protein [Aestuariivirga sp.]|uniref:DUF736 family protein n=1 Tax=Aestuariivirga sp. TaxID=2650926 RepID=UPI0039E238AA